MYLFFENGFIEDTIDVFINSEDYSRRVTITTEPSLGIADVMVLHQIRAIESVQISKNNGKKLDFSLNNKEMNMWAINFWSDTLRANRLQYAPMYE